ncbi:hypothetical protein [Pectobacterium versatile]|uniref:hypothetical protein n=1 Tax=Pectobacterium versatile TaxID=2488639 RepID=UPI0010E662FC|nr:hypothetical protein [Pectobacterium versatile]TAI97093.1 hypothetical protein EG335_11685 [Pectobacterium versatile]
MSVIQTYAGWGCGCNNVPYHGGLYGGDPRLLWDTAKQVQDIVTLSRDVDKAFGKIRKRHER